MNVQLSINKEAVYREVGQTTSYTGAKMDDDPNAYERIFTTDEDQCQLERFWDESCTAFCEVMKKYLISDKIVEEGHLFSLDFSRAFDAALLPSMQKDLFSYFVMNITSKWYGFTNKKEAGEYGAAAIALLEGIHRKACFKRKPTRPIYF